MSINNGAKKFMKELIIKDSIEEYLSASKYINWKDENVFAKAEGELLGGCLESFYDILTNTRYEDEKETCEEKPVPELFEKEVRLLKRYLKSFLRMHM